MAKEDSKLFFLWTIKILILASFFAPLIVGGSFYFPYIVPKTVFFQITVELALFFYTLFIVTDRNYLPKWDMLAKSVIAFFGIYAIAGILGANPERSFFGTYERMLGVLNVAHFVALFFVARAVFVSNKDWLLAFRAFLLASVSVGLYGFGQWLGLSFLYHAGAGRIDATIGNPAFVAGYFIFAAFFAVFALIKDSNRWFKYFYIFALVLSIWAVYASATRGGILGLAAAAVIIIAAYFLRKEKKFVFKKEFLLTGAIIAAIIFGAAFLAGGKGNFLSPLGRFSGIMESATTQTRLLAAKSSWEGFLARPILGWGPQNYNLVFDKYYNPKIYPAENWFDHAHSIIFDTLVATGAVGSAVYLFFLGVIVFYCWRFIRLGRENYWPGVFAVALMAAYFTQNVFVFDSLVTYLPFFLFIAFIGATFSANSGETVTVKNAKKLMVGGELPIPTIVILFVVFGLSGYWMSVRPALGAYFAVQALMTNPEQTDAVIDYFKKSLSYGTPAKNAEIAGRIADLAIQLLGSDKIDQQKKKEFFDFANQETMKAVEENPLDFRDYLYRASFLSQSSSFSGVNDNSFLKEADKVLSDAEKLAPRKQLLYVEWGGVKMRLGDRDGAIDKFKTAVELNPDVNDLRWRLASAYTRAGKISEGEAEAEEARRAFSENNPQAKINGRAELDLAFAFRESGSENKEFKIMRNILAGKDSITDSYVFIKLAEEFARKGEKENAAAAARRVMEIDPSLKEESERFIQQLEAR